MRPSKKKIQKFSKIFLDKLRKISNYYKVFKGSRNVGLIYMKIEPILPRTITEKRKDK